MHILCVLKRFSNCFLCVCLGGDGAQNLSWLTQVVIKRELVVVPDLEDKLRRNLIFCLVQAPEVLLKSDQKRNQGKNKRLISRRGQSQATLISQPWKSHNITEIEASTSAHCAVSSLVLKWPYSSFLLTSEVEVYNNVRSVTIRTSLFYPMGIFCLFSASRPAVPTPGKVLQQSQTPVCKAPGMKIALESSLAIIIIYQALA